MLFYSLYGSIQLVMFYSCERDWTSHFGINPSTVHTYTLITLFDRLFSECSNIIHFASAC